MNAIYQTKTDERWDQVAYKAYGDSTKVSDIIAANPGVAISDVIPAGTRLIIPIIEISQTDKTVLPPWKQ